MKRLLPAVLAAVVLWLSTGCGTGIVVDKGFRTRQVVVNGQTQYQPCWWVKFRDSAGETHTQCTAHAKWTHVNKGDQWGSA